MKRRVNAIYRIQAPIMVLVKELSLEPNIIVTTLDIISALISVDLIALGLVIAELGAFFSTDLKGAPDRRRTKVLSLLEIHESPQPNFITISLSMLSSITDRSLVAWG